MKKNHTKGAYIKNVIDKNLDAWHKLVPPQSEMTSRNCWYIRNFNLSPIDFTLRMKKLFSMVNIKRLLQKDKVRMLMKYLFRKISYCSLLLPSYHISNRVSQMWHYPSVSVHCISFSIC